jgi:hypothetical protein
MTITAKVAKEDRSSRTQRLLLFGGRICEEREPFLEATEVALVAAKCAHPLKPWLNQLPLPGRYRPAVPPGTGRPRARLR